MTSFLSGLFGGGYGEQAAQENQALAAQYQTNALQALKSGYATGTEALQTGIGGYSPLAALGTRYAGAVQPTVLGALGVGTPEENAAAQNAFQMSPGQQYALTQALQAGNRAAAIGGMGGTGNAIYGAEATAAGLTNQYYQQWLQNLMGLGTQGAQEMQAAATGQMYGYGSLANLAQTYGENQVNVYGNTEQQMIAANNQAAASQAQGAGNILNLAGNVAEAGAMLALL